MCVWPPPWKRQISLARCSADIVRTYISSGIYVCTISFLGFQLRSLYKTSAFYSPPPSPAPPKQQPWTRAPHPLHPTCKLESTIYISKERGWTIHGGCLKNFKSYLRTSPRPLIFSSPTLSSPPLVEKYYYGLLGLVICIMQRHVMPVGAQLHTFSKVFPRSQYSLFGFECQEKFVKRALKSQNCL